MKEPKLDSSTPNVIRAAMRAAMYEALGTLTEIIDDPEARNADKIKAIHVLGQFGLGTADQAAIHIHAGEGSQVIGVVKLPALDPVGRASGEALEGGEVE